jgi:hypothetical protein
VSNHPKVKVRARYVLKHADGRYYCFTDRVNYDGPQFSKDPGTAKRMTAAGCSQAQRMLADPKFHGEVFERVPVTEQDKADR